MEIERYIGLVKYRDELFKVKGVLADFILDYVKNDPSFAKDSRSNSFRDRILTVTVDNAPGFLRALDGEKINQEFGEVKNFIVKAGEEFIVFIDFDSRRFIHSYFDLALEDYVPKNWIGRLGDPRQTVLEWLRTP